MWTEKKARVQKYRYGVRSKQQTTDNGDREAEDMGTGKTGTEARVREDGREEREWVGGGGKKKKWR